jgi:hypothetical protein
MKPYTATATPSAISNRYLNFATAQDYPQARLRLQDVEKATHPAAT